MPGNKKDFTAKAKVSQKIKDLPKDHKLRFKGDENKKSFGFLWCP